jgi:thymidylate kinase
VNAAALLDSYAPAPVLVFGSLPPHNRDLDVLAGPREHEVLERVLTSAGFLKHDVEWVRFEDCGVSLVDLVPVGDWDLPDTEVTALFDQAQPIARFANLVQPSPHHALLILARRVARGGGILDDKRRARVETALAQDPDAWDRARERAPAWAAERLLQFLEGTYKTGIPAPRLKRTIGLADRLQRRNSPTTAYAKAFKSARRRSHRRVVIAFSGLDGSGKSSQAQALRSTLERLGYDTVVVWSRLSYNPSLNWIARPIKSLFAGLRGKTLTRDGVALSGRELRQSSRLMTTAWAGVVAIANGLTHRRIVRYHQRRGVIVICDRYLLDSAVHLRFRYGLEDKLSWQKRITRLLSPPPTRAYYIDVPPEVALSRKAEQYELPQLTLQAGLYRQEQASFGVRKLDGLLAPEKLCEAIGRDVWAALHGTRRS